MQNYMRDEQIPGLLNAENSRKFYRDSLLDRINRKPLVQEWLQKSEELGNQNYPTKQYLESLKNEVLAYLDIDENIETLNDCFTKRSQGNSHFPSLQDLKDKSLELIKYGTSKQLQARYESKELSFKDLANLMYKISYIKDEIKAQYQDYLTNSAIESEHLDEITPDLLAQKAIELQQPDLAKIINFKIEQIQSSNQDEVKILNEIDLPTLKKKISKLYAIAVVESQNRYVFNNSLSNIVLELKALAQTNIASDTFSVLTEASALSCYHMASTGNNNAPSLQDLTRLIGEGASDRKIAVLTGYQAMRLYNRKSITSQMPQFSDLKDLHSEEISFFISSKVARYYRSSCYSAATFIALGNLDLVEAIVTALNKRFMIGDRGPEDMVLPAVDNADRNTINRTITKAITNFTKQAFIDSFEANQDRPGFTFNPEKLPRSLISPAIKNQLAKVGRSIAQEYNRANPHIAHIGIKHFLTDLPEDGLFQELMHSVLEFINTILEQLEIPQIERGFSTKYKYDESQKSFTQKIEDFARANGIDVERRR